MNKKLLLLLIGVNVAMILYAQTPMVDRQISATAKNTKMIFVDGKPQADSLQWHMDSMYRQISSFYYDQFRHFQDPQAPYFLFMSKDAQLAMGIGGAVRMRGYFDWGGAMPGAGFSPYLIPIPADPASMKHFATTPSGTCLFFRVIGRNKALGDYQLYIETDFTGYQGRDLKLKKAYAMVNDFTIGYASSTFSDPSALPPVIDAQGPSNKITPTAVLVRYMPVIKKKIFLAVSAETPSTQIDAAASDVKKATSWMPDFAAFVQYQWAQGQHVRLSGILRTLSYRNLRTSTNHNPIGWGVMLSSVAHPEQHLTTYVTLNYGRGIGSLGGDLMMGDYDLLGDPEKPGQLYAPRSFGWCIGLQYNFMPNLFVSASASQTHFLPDHTCPPSDYKYGIVGDVNIFWNLTPRIQVGGEFDMGVRHNFDGAHRTAKRVNLMTQFSF